MGDILANLPLDVAWGGLVAFAILSIMRGWLVPQKWHVERLADKDSQIHSLRSALTAADEARDTLMAQNTELIRSNETTIKVLESLRVQATKDR